MRYHHTKNKGDLGAIQVMADMTQKGYSILLPLTEHEAFDFVAYKDERFFRVQAKYRAAVNGVVTAPLSTCWADRNGVHTTPINRQSIDLIAIYCPDTASCYYVDPQSWALASINLRIEPPRNGQRKRIAWAHDYRDIPATVRGISGGFSLPLVAPPTVRHSREPRASWLM